MIRLPTLSFWAWWLLLSWPPLKQNLEAFIQLMFIPDKSSSGSDSIWGQAYLVSLQGSRSSLVTADWASTGCERRASDPSSGEANAYRRHSRHFLEKVMKKTQKISRQDGKEGRHPLWKTQTSLFGSLCPGGAKQDKYNTMLRSIWDISYSNLLVYIRHWTGYWRQNLTSPLLTLLILK